jgi:pimeloyl-ACP methyl ester carboxylesterase
MERFRRRYGSADYRAATGVMRQTLVAAVNESYEDELRSIKAPVHLIWGEADTEVPVRIAVEAAALLKGAGVEVTIEVVPGVGHWLPTEAPTALQHAVEAMLSNP